MGFKLIDRECDVCEHTNEYLTDTTDEIDKTGKWPCTQEGCKGTLSKKLGTPHLRTSESSTRLGGSPRAGWDTLKREAAIDLLKADATPSERAYIDKHSK